MYNLSLCLMSSRNKSSRNKSLRGNKRSYDRTHIPLMTILCGIISLTMSLSVYAEEREEVTMKRLLESNAVRHHRMLRDGRFAVIGGIGSTLLEPFIQSTLISAQAQYYLNDRIGIGAYGFVAVNAETGLVENIRAQRPQLALDDHFAGLGFGAGAEMIYIPAFGKFSLLGQFMTRYDLQLLAGAAFLNVTGIGTAKSTVAPSIGLGSRFFFNDSMAVDVQLRDYLYARATNSIPVEGQNPVSTEEFLNQFTFQLTVSYFFGQPKVGE